ncbi:MAG: hypothetical protein N4A33_07880 [Bacteriovoracaceae bacterium]|jgi:A/G-specific adenine glycosylase|nr:hypothetical protein [Bacteriovoracaceae bacterium]
MNQKLIQWSKENFSDLPWRKNRTLYRTLVSEIMLQQTTVSTVLNHFERFLKVFPDVKALAKASSEDVLIQWKGLGYYRRARNLKSACEYFYENFKGQIPLDYELLIKAPGIGDYTANAILSIGADKKGICLDANLERIIARLYCIEEFKGPKLIKKIHNMYKDNLILSELENFSARDFNESLMDVGRVYCQARKADCLHCPLKKNCKSFKLKKGTTYPKLILKQKKFFNLELIRFVIQKNGKVYSYKKNSDQWLSNQYELPTFILQSEDNNLKQYPKLKGHIENLYFLDSIMTSITKYKITNYYLICDEKEFQKITGEKVNSFELVNPNDAKSNLSTASLKVLSKI